jgi:hypothetical protein
VDPVASGEVRQAGWQMVEAMGFPYVVQQRLAL